MKTVSYKRYLLACLAVIMAFNSVDRIALGLVFQNVKADFHLSDTQLGFLTGIAFALFYSLMGIPIARWADRGNRVTIIAVTTALWSLAVALCGAAANFLQLLLIRIGVAVGEAGCIPTASSLIADNFDRAERPRAMARYMLGGPFALVIGYFLAGWLNEYYGWRTMFVLLSLPGVGLAVLAWCTLREPRRNETTVGVEGAIDRGAHGALPVAHPSLKAVFLTLWSGVTFRHMLISFAITSFFNTGITQWQPSFFVRSYGMQTGELGTWLAITYGLGSLVGIYYGGEWACRRAAHNESLQLKAMATGYACFAVLFVGIYFSPSRYLAFGLMGLATVGGMATTGPMFATIQTLVPPPMRAVAIALLFLFGNLIGMGLGPLAVGALSDTLRPLLGEESLRYALVIMCPGYLWGGWHLWQASRTVARDVELVRAEFPGVTQMPQEALGTA